MPSLFAITTAANSVPLDGNRQGQTVFTVSNTSVHPVRGRARIAPDGSAAASWFTLTGGAERDFTVNGTQQYTVQIAVPQTVTAGNYTMRLDMVGVDNPDEDFTQGPSVTFAVPEPLPVKKPFPWWIIAVAAVIVIAAIVLITRSSQDSAAKQAAEATATAEALQQAANAANATATARAVTAAKAATSTAQAAVAGATATAESAAAQSAAATATAAASVPNIAAKATDGPVTITNVKLNGGGNVATMSPGANFTISMDYFIIDTGCPGCIDQIQIGYSDTAPNVCAYSGIPGTAGQSGSGNVTLTAPATAGTYFIGFDRSQDFSCPNHWWNSAPDASRYIAAIIVK